MLAGETTTDKEVLSSHYPKPRQPFHIPHYYRAPA